MVWYYIIILYDHSDFIEVLDETRVPLSAGFSRVLDGEGAGHTCAKVTNTESKAGKVTMAWTPLPILPIF